MRSVFSATSRAPASFCTSGASSILKRRNVSRGVEIMAEILCRGGEDVADTIGDLARRCLEAIAPRGVEE